MKKKAKAQTKKISAKKSAKALGAKKSGTKKVVAKKTSPVPKGYHTVTPHLIIKGCADAIAWYAQAFGAKELSRMPGQDGRLLHAEVRIGDSIVMMSDEFPEQGNGRRAPTSAGLSTGGLMLYVKDVDAWFGRAVAGGAKTTMPVADMFWGDRYGQLIDPFGHTWAIATRKADLSPKQMAKAAQEAMTSPAQQAA